MSPFRVRRSTLTAILLFIVCFTFYVNSPYDSSESSYDHGRHRIQYSFGQPSNASLELQQQRLDAVKTEFLHSWKGYKSRAWMFDELRPVSGGNYTKFCGWAATLVDTLDTLHIMGLKDEWKEAVDATLTLNFNTLSWSCSVNVFEMVIRHLGGLIAAYDIDGGKDKRLLDKSVEIGEMLFTAFDTRNGLQCSFFKWPKNPQYNCSLTRYMSLSGLGSANLEFIRLSIITGDPKYANAIGHIASELARTQDHTFIPGLWPEIVDASCEKGLCEVTGRRFSLGTSGDSAFEYLLKSHLLFGAKDSTYATMWEKAVIAMKQHVLYQPMTIDNQDILFAGLLTGGTPSGIVLEPVVEHLQCFLGGVFALSAKAFRRIEDMKIAAKLTEGCVWAYGVTKTGIMPENFHAIHCEDHAHCPWNEATWKRETAGSTTAELPHGISQIDDGRYLLRPEAIESVFIMYRITGDQKWRDKGWEMFESVRAHTRTEWGHSCIDNVMKSSPSLTDEMESFWLAETLKYYYLLFSDPSLVSLDEYVLNTEAHPLRLSSDLRGF